MLSIPLAKQLRSAGLQWRPRKFDFFHIPDRDLDDRLFVVADFSIDVQRLADGIAAITFNGAVEWSLDYILQQDVVWLPTEAQLRDLIGDRFRGLVAAGDGWEVLVADGDRVDRHRADTPANAYASALLAQLSTSS
ncbi:MAG: pilus assembly protein CpaE [Acidimicrobiia bacterium]|nr:pilus assembly protein CpaE [Acidimicrobiia bacterium]